MSAWTGGKRKICAHLLMRREYLPVIERIEAGIPFPFPHKKQINKMHSNKKRIIYTFDRAENYVLKLLAQQLHAYDGCFGKNLYSFRNELRCAACNCGLTGSAGDRRDVCL